MKEANQRNEKLVAEMTNLQRQVKNLGEKLSAEQARSDDLFEKNRKIEAPLQRQVKNYFV